MLSTLWSLNRAAPVLLRHLSAYADLAEQDLGVSQRDLAQRVKAGFVFVLSAGFALLMVCAGVIAATWDTPNRIAAISIMCAVFVILAVASGYLATRRGAIQPFASVRREWRQDRVILDQMFSEADSGANDDR